ncbi:hypothetical protein MMC19_004212 [Ptychographa xylographoides]|nr:hypothetical protein [Ptychographa xylographoides]
MSLPSSYTNELNTLNREVLKAQPKDVLQFCANFFNRRLESQRAEYLLSTKSAGKMAEHSFPGSNPFGGGLALSSPSAMQQVREEDEMESTASPTASTFGQAGRNAPGSGLFPGGEDGQTQSPFSSNYSPSQPPSSFKPVQQPSSEGFPSNYAMGRRTSVSAESMNPQDSMDDNWKPPHHAKSDEQLARLKTAVGGNFLFSHLDDEQTSQVLGALVEKPIPAKGIKVISQGDAGDYFYIVEKGSFDIYIHAAGSVQPGPDGVGKKVNTIGPGGSFGELALMYNAPRAATVMSTEPGSLLWYLDRVTFRRILMDSAFARRRMYENFLNEVPLLSTLAPYERSKIADALETQKFPAGSTIIKEGDPGEAFYLLESGSATVHKRETGEKVLMSYKKGDYFGELALLDDKPRAASVVSTEEVKVATLGKEGFLRLLGPVEERMRKNDPSKRGVEVQTKSQTGVEEKDPLSK